MAGKNNRRYKVRKQMCTGKHMKTVFTEPPTLISSWEELNGLENDKYFIEVEVENGRGYVRPKFDVPTDKYYDHNVYLHTHTFYGTQYFESTNTLRRLGFNVQLSNWEGETVYCRY
jgi:predicted GTPase